VNAHAALHKLRIREANLSDPAECRRIENYVRAHDAGTPFHVPQWLKAVEAGCGQRGHMLLAERAGDLRGLLPLTEVHSALFGRTLVSSGFAVAGGTLVSNPRNATGLANAGWDLAERLSCPEVELRGGALPKAWQKREGVYAGFVKALAADEEAELKAVPRKQRAEIRKALGNDLTVETGREERDRAAHYAVYAHSVRNLGTPVFPRALFDAMLDGFGEEADILTVRHKGEPVASVLSFYFGGTAMPYWGGGTRAARHLRANERMYFALMNHARERGCTRFDFGRSKTGTGPYSYKKNWGFEPEPLIYAGRTASGAAPREMNPNSPKYRLQVSLWKRLPLGIANRAGPWIAKGVG
jgi:FemAB-related protein (PEP-CTERM system-associated)